MQALISGQVHAMFFQGSGAVWQNVKAGKLDALAITAPTRSPLHPELPTIAETYPGWQTQAWVAMFAPAGTPRQLIDRLHTALVSVLASPLMKERFEAQGAEVVAGTPEDLTRLLREEQAKWGRIIRNKKITAE